MGGNLHCQANVRCNTLRFPRVNDNYGSDCFATKNQEVEVFGDLNLLLKKSKQMRMKGMDDNANREEKIMYLKVHESQCVAGDLMSNLEHSNKQQETPLRWTRDRTWRPIWVDWRTTKWPRWTWPMRTTRWPRWTAPNREVEDNSILFRKRKNGDSAITGINGITGNISRTGSKYVKPKDSAIERNEHGQGGHINILPSVVLQDNFLE